MTTTGEHAPTTTDAVRPQERYVRFLRKPPALWFHLTLVPLTLVLLWGMTVPGGSTAGWVASLVLFLLALVWGARVVLSFTMGDRWSWWFVVAPLCGALVAALYLAAVPLKARWSVSANDAFVAALAEVPEPTAAQLAEAAENEEEGVPVSEMPFVVVDTPRSIGGYDVTSIEVQGDLTTFAVDSVCPGCVAGFAHDPTLSTEDAGYVWADHVSLGDGWWAWYSETTFD